MIATAGLFPGAQRFQIEKGEKMSHNSLVAPIYKMWYSHLLRNTSVVIILLLYLYFLAIDLWVCKFKELVNT